MVQETRRSRRSARTGETFYESTIKVVAQACQLRMPLSVGYLLASNPAGCVRLTDGGHLWLRKRKIAAHSKAVMETIEGRRSDASILDRQVNDAILRRPPLTLWRRDAGKDL